MRPQHVMEYGDQRVLTATGAASAVRTSAPAVGWRQFCLTPRHDDMTAMPPVARKSTMPLAVGKVN